MSVDTGVLAMRGARVAQRAPVPVLRLAFIGTGWIGRQRMQSLVASHDVQVAAIVEPDAARAREAAALIDGDPPVFDSLASWLANGPACDGAVIATPSALHAAQAIAVLQAGLPVFVQKPLARTRDETAQVIEAARRADRALGVDFSYRGVSGLTQARRRLADGAIGSLFSVDLVFHNAWAPDAGWAHTRSLSGGGCVMDLGCHLVDLLGWMRPDDPVLAVQAARFAAGRRCAPLDPAVEDYALATLHLQSGVEARLVCSWHAHQGEEATIEATFRGTRGSMRLLNEGGSFTRLSVYQCTGTHRERLGDPSCPWGGVEIGHWAERVAQGKGFCAERAARYLEVADVLDRINAQ